MNRSGLLVSQLVTAVILASGVDPATAEQLNWVVGDGIESTVDATSPVGPVALIEVRGKFGSIDVRPISAELSMTALEPNIFVGVNLINRKTIVAEPVASSGVALTASP